MVTDDLNKPPQWNVSIHQCSVLRQGVVNHVSDLTVETVTLTWRSMHDWCSELMAWKWPMHAVRLGALISCGMLPAADRLERCWWKGSSRSSMVSASACRPLETIGPYHNL